ncbi:TetR family transcriptional regulator [Chromohalobacter marismortui]|uniref:TetR family transcriptional regulator n=1 Tax=Chromohalobacter marismortui TaxID=42055 RepID=A0A4R7NMT1_9GAMM|nr:MULTISPECIES: TetR/AcrR family transcriptional regulator [Chromohalobacter]MCI0509956.1 TetR/AcrR family transcriptional regulator [Chromohalobacter sp.]MCI0593112.1 TetR/AcrR family transcriptional regulator [Chromohalobacter sp.]TDU22145.1 TetR family transcriptional regulator [Chromohalobacter marismortui]
MDIRTRLLETAEQLFERHGFTATGMDRLTSAAGISSRTLYKHVGNKNGLIVAVMNERDRRFHRLMKTDSIDALFTTLQTWFTQEGARGCLSLRAWGETGGGVPEIAEAMERHKQRLRERIDAIVLAEIGRHDTELAEAIQLLFEGAIHAATYRGGDAAQAARRTAHRLADLARAA